jgi:hypothetical protein
VGTGYVQVTFADVDTSAEPKSDAGLLAAGYATFTPLRPVCEAAEVEAAGLAQAVPVSTEASDGSGEDA